ncbi:MAG: NAD(+)/NADH kinase [Actinobacteria bacterium]|nr:NAD(+)/NADH kinase [Actinomycetota bacterium]
MKVAIVPNGNNTRVLEATYTIMTWLSSQGIEVQLIKDVFDEEGVCETCDIETLRGMRDPALDGCLFVIALGGDGTTLRAARLVGYSEIPILSLNYGTLGFLSSGSAEDMMELVGAALAGECEPVRRSTLEIDLEFPDETKESCFALNEVVVARGSSGRVIDFGLAINGVSIANMRGDGVLVSTATGSTAYALSAGGPIVAPGHKGFIVLPIAPHTLQTRAIVTGPSDFIEIDLTQRKFRDVTIYIDGSIFPCGIPSRMRVRRGEGDILLMQFEEGAFYKSVSRVFFGKEK